MNWFRLLPSSFLFLLVIPKRLLFSRHFHKPEKGTLVRLFGRLFSELLRSAITIGGRPCFSYTLPVVSASDPVSPRAIHTSYKVSRSAGPGLLSLRQISSDLVNFPDVSCHVPADAAIETFCST
jgi:hypothetical protein